MVSPSSDQNHGANLRLLEEIEADTYAEKARELRDEEAELQIKIEAASRSHHETIDLAIRAFELPQNLRAKWFEADVAAKRRILEIIGLNWKLDGVSLVPEMRKPFDILAEGLSLKKSRGDRTAIELFPSSLGEWTKSLIAIAQALAA